MSIVISAATSNLSSPAATSFAAGVALRVCQWGNVAQTASASAGWRLHRAVRGQKEAFERRLQEFVLELLAAIVLIAIFMVLTDPATRSDSASL